MEINRIDNSINYSKKCNAPSFKAGISSRLFSKLRQDGADIVEIMKKTDDIYNINDKNFVLADAVYNAKEKTADFFLSAVDMIKFIPGLENVSPKVVKAKGEKLSDAFQNIKLNDLKQANMSLAAGYNKRYEETKPLRAELKSKREAVEAKLKEKFEKADGFWNNYYRKLDEAKDKLAKNVTLG